MNHWQGFRVHALSHWIDAGMKTFSFFLIISRLNDLVSLNISIIFGISLWIWKRFILTVKLSSFVTIFFFIIKNSFHVIYNFREYCSSPGQQQTDFKTAPPTSFTRATCSYLMTYKHWSSGPGIIPRQRRYSWLHIQQKNPLAAPAEPFPNTQWKKK